MKKTIQTIVIGALIYTVLNILRLFILNINTESTYLLFLLENFAIFSAVSLIALAIGLSKVKFLLFVCIVSPLYTILPTLYLNLRHLGLEQYLKTTDFNVAIGIIVFSVVSAFVASLYIIKSKHYAYN